MRVKIVGIGKCGVRIAYDFFAYTGGFPLAYEIRLTKHESSFYKMLERTKVDITAAKQSVLRIRAYFKGVANDVSGLYRVAEIPEYATIDSDISNNEIISQAALFDDEGREAIFPGKRYSLHNHVGGCNFHIVSEDVVRGWEDLPFQITNSNGVSIYVTSFSIAGGTGGGSAPIICQVSREDMRNQNSGHDMDAQNRCHHMGLGILPKSDERYREDENALNMADYEKFNTGRFFASIYGGRFRNGVKSLWLFSNDVLRFLIEEQKETKALSEAGGEMKLNLSLVNAFIAQSLTVLSNSSSILTSAETNLDPRELNDILAGRPFMSALSKRQVTNADRGKEHQTVKELLLGALSNVREQDGWLEGLSVPVRESGLQGLHKILEDMSGDRKQFLESLDEYDAAESPIEFRTTGRLVMVYGEPEKQYSEQKKTLIMSACEKFFPNAQKYPFTFRHHGSIEILLLFFVDPFIRPVVSSVYYYANNAWSRSGEDLTAKYDTLIGSDEFCEPKFLNSNEDFPFHIYGDGVDDVSQRVKANPALVIEREAIVNTFRHLHEIYHRKRPTMNTSSNLG